LAELRDALHNNASIRELLDDYKKHLQYHSNQNKFYYLEDSGNKVFCDNTDFKKKFIDEKVAGLNVSVVFWPSVQG